MKESLDLLRTRTQDASLAQLSLARLSTSLRLLAAEVSALNESRSQLAANMQRWSGSFTSLLKDVVRHSDVLALLLGEEVPEVLEWPVQDHKASSIPVLREQLGLLQEQLRDHNLSISSLLAQHSGGFSAPCSVLLRTRSRTRSCLVDQCRMLSGPLGGTTAKGSRVSS